MTDDIEKLHFNVCVAHIYEFANALNAVIGDIGVGMGRMRAPGRARFPLGDARSG